LIGTPLALASALAVIRLGTVITGAKARVGDGAGDWPAAGRNAATSAPPIAPWLAVGEITTGGGNRRARGRRSEA
jgi:hypothetical protein